MWRVIRQASQQFRVPWRNNQLHGTLDVRIQRANLSTREDMEQQNYQGKTQTKIWDYKAAVITVLFRLSRDERMNKNHKFFVQRIDNINIVVQKNPDSLGLLGEGKRYGQSEGTAYPGTVYKFKYKECYLGKDFRPGISRYRVNRGFHS